MRTDSFVDALLKHLGHNMSLAADLGQQIAYFLPTMESFLQTEAGWAVPKYKHFTLSCRCADSVNVMHADMLPVNLPIGSCASNFALVSRIYTPGCPTNETDICQQRQIALDERVRRYFAPLLAWNSRWSKVSEHHFSDFSAATRQPILGTTGGDLAELVVALAVYEGMSLITLSESQVRKLLRNYLSASSKRTFYFATDRSSLEDMARLMRLDYLDVRLPPKQQRQRLLTGLTYPGQNGCRHFRYMLAYPAEYEVRRELGVACIAAFFEVLWDRDDPAQLWKRLRLVVFTDDEEKPREQAIVFVKTYQECIDYGVAPLAPPRRGNMLVAVLHLQAVAIMRQELTSWLATLLTDDIDRQRILDSIQSLADLHTQNTLRHAFEGRLPIYDANFLVQV